MNRKQIPFVICLLLASSSVLAEHAYMNGGFSATSPSTDPSTFESSSATTADSPEYAEGIRAIHESRWADAIQIFSHIIDTHGATADAAHYWKAYALNKTGKSNDSVGVCTHLEQNFSPSRWIEECEALKIEIKAKTNQPVEQNDATSDSGQLLALNLMMRKDKQAALDRIDEILNSGGSESTKKEALLVLSANHSEIVDAQIVRIRMLEGDVRIHRTNDKNNSAEWSQAVDSLQLDSGDSLVTEDGRAEIEFENASTMYLDKNSVLTLNTLDTVNGVPFTDISLLSGTASFHIRLAEVNEKFQIHTPTDTISARFPQEIHIRLTSFSDAISFVRLNTNPTDNGADHAKDPVDFHERFYFSGGHAIEPVPGEEPQRYVEWDTWTQQHYEQRLSAMAQMQKDSGLNVPLPGLDELAGAGGFFDCPPYGRCWEPKIDLTSASAQNLKSSTAPSTADQLDPMYIQTLYFACVPTAYNIRAYLFTQRWYWSTCHTGYWTYHPKRKHYVWVPGPNRHHKPPVVWVKQGHTLAYVPIHPKTGVTGHTVDREGIAFSVGPKGVGEPVPIQLNGNEPISELKYAPRAYRSEFTIQLKAMNVPSMATSTMRSALGNNHASAGNGSVPIHFDSVSGSFLAPKTVLQGGESKTIMTPISVRAGGSQIHSTVGAAGVSTRGSTSSSASTSSGAHASAPIVASPPSSSATSTPSPSSGSSGGHH
jgi:hypothetical protein